MHFRIGKILSILQIYLSPLFQILRNLFKTLQHFGMLRESLNFVEIFKALCHVNCPWKNFRPFWLSNFTFNSIHAALRRSPKPHILIYFTFDLPLEHLNLTVKKGFRKLTYSVLATVMSREELSWKPVNGRNQTLLTIERGRFVEVAGGTTAECAAVCCCPCALVHLAVLALVKLPAGLCKKALKKMKRKPQRRSKQAQGKGSFREETDLELESSVSSSQSDMLRARKGNGLVIDHACISNEEFWEEVTGNRYVGFWRNHSLKD